MPPAEKSDPSESPVASRLAALRFAPGFFAAVGASAMGPLPDLWERLDEAGRSELAQFETAFREGLRCELRGEMAEAAAIYRRLCEDHPRFALIARERIEQAGSTAP